MRGRYRTRRRPGRPSRAGLDSWPLLVAAAVLGLALVVGATLAPQDGPVAAPAPVRLPGPLRGGPSSDVPAAPRGEPASAAGSTVGDRPAPNAPAQPGAEQALAAPPLLPDLRVLEPSGFYLVDQSSSGGHRRLKFTTTIWNAGPGPLEVRGREHPETGELVVYQTFHTATGDVVPGEQVGTFQFDHRHGHLHLTTFARYELWTVAPDGGLGELVARNEKVGFCLMDNVPVEEELIDASRGVYPVDCRGDVQGISPGYGDVYVAQLYEQDLIVDGLPDGRYALVNVVNPAGAIAEVSLDNNRAVAYVRLSDGAVLAD